MLPERPLALNPDFDANFASRNAHSETAPPVQHQQAVSHHQQVCPNCSQTLSGYHCKLVCTQCGYYLSCSDFY
jgi:ribosomal protein S27AE